MVDFGVRLFGIYVFVCIRLRFGKSEVDDFVRVVWLFCGEYLNKEFLKFFFSFFSVGVGMLLKVDKGEEFIFEYCESSDCVEIGDDDKFW